MIYTARQVQEMYRAHGRVVLPAGARLSPLARDWAREKRVEVTYESADAPQTGEFGAPATDGCAALATRGCAPPATGGCLWWCDGPCGGAKAAMVALEREAGLARLPVAHEPTQLASAVRQVAGAVNTGSASGAVLLVRTGAAVVLANRCPSLRAIVGTSLETVEDGLKHVSANVLIIEHPRMTMMQVRNLALRFVRGIRPMSDEVARQLREMTSCG